MKPYWRLSNMLQATVLTCGDTPVAGTRTGTDHVVRLHTPPRHLESERHPPDRIKPQRSTRRGRDRDDRVREGLTAARDSNRRRLAGMYLVLCRVFNLVVDAPERLTTSRLRLRIRRLGGRTPSGAHRAGFGSRRDDVDGVLDGIPNWSVTTSWRRRRRRPARRPTLARCSSSSVSARNSSTSARGRPEPACVATTPHSRRGCGSSGSSPCSSSRLRGGNVGCSRPAASAVPPSRSDPNREWPLSQPPSWSARAGSPSRERAPDSVRRSRGRGPVPTTARGGRRPGRACPWPSVRRSRRCRRLRPSAAEARPGRRAGPAPRRAWGSPPCRPFMLCQASTVCLVRSA